MSKSLSYDEKNGMSTFDYIITIISAVYIISPVDAIPDAIPFAGWMDDVLAAITAGTTILNSQLSTANTTLSGILKTLRFISISIIVLVGVLVLIFGALIYQIFS
jgi:uncharacterized membrane protein YkvA (DUF1232 family)